MTNRSFNLDDYVPVNERIEAFRAAFPDGSLQSEITHLSDGLVIVKAYAYRTPDDARPGIGHSSLEIPGRTPYTRGSEIENAETSAWGRALAALGFEVKRGIASHEEVRNKREDAPRTPAMPRSGDGIANVGALLTWANTTFQMTRAEVLGVLGVEQPSDIKNFSDAVARIEAAVAEVAGAR